MKEKRKGKVKVVGGGLAGTEAALYLANRGVEVDLYDIKPNGFTPAHKNADFCELVCSNSLKSNDVYGNAAGLLKEELRILGSEVIASADLTKVPAGNALAVDRDKFAKSVTEKINGKANITVISEEVTKVCDDRYDAVIIATGPLTTDALSASIKEKVGGGFSFFDASAPIVTFESIDKEECFFGDRYGKGGGDHLNCPMDKPTYLAFTEALTSAERIPLHSFEDVKVFEGCMPVEIMAARGVDTLRFGPLKPTGLDDPKTGRWPYACLQLRKENTDGTLFNLVGFQTNLKWGEQKRVFGIIPALKNAEYVRYGVMHRNSFINSPEVLNVDFSLKSDGRIYFAGQITGVEGYVESVMSGLFAAINCERKLSGKEMKIIGDDTVSGALIKYVTTKNADFQPMNANFGIMPKAEIIKDKSLRKRKIAERSLEAAKKFSEEIL